MCNDSSICTQNCSHLYKSSFIFYSVSCIALSFSVPTSVKQTATQQVCKKTSQFSQSHCSTSPGLDWDCS